jgi:hypothetical protein
MLYHSYAECQGRTAGAPGITAASFMAPDPLQARRPQSGECVGFGVRRSLGRDGRSRMRAAP